MLPHLAPRACRVSAERDSRPVGGPYPAAAPRARSLVTERHADRRRPIADGRGRRTRTRTRRGRGRRTRRGRRPRTRRRTRRRTRPRPRFQPRPRPRRRPRCRSRRALPFRASPAMSGEKLAQATMSVLTPHREIVRRRKMRSPHRASIHTGLMVRRPASAATSGARHSPMTGCASRPTSGRWCKMKMRWDQATGRSPSSRQSTSRFRR